MTKLITHKELVEDLSDYSDSCTFDNQNCIKCNQPFYIGEDVIYRVLQQRANEDGSIISYIVPIHIGCESLS